MAKHEYVYSGSYVGGSVKFTIDNNVMTDETMKSYLDCRKDGEHRIMCAGEVIQEAFAQLLAETLLMLSTMNPLHNKSLEFYPGLMIELDGSAGVELIDHEQAEFDADQHYDYVVGSAAQ